MDKQSRKIIPLRWVKEQIPKNNEQQVEIQRFIQECKKLYEKT